jgi:NDP-sugar pyrophosphorylase family protein
MFEGRDLSADGILNRKGRSDLTDVTAVILAGGLGSRLHSVVADRPKALADIRGKPFLTYLFEQLVAGGLRDIVLCTGYLGDQISRLFGERYGSLRLVYSREPEPLGTAGALRLALPLLKSDSVLVMNGDSYCDANFQELRDWHNRRRANATLLLTEASDSRRFGRVQVSDDGAVTDFDEKDERSGPGWINSGIYLLTRRMLTEVPAERPVSLETEIFPAWIGRGLYGFRKRARFVDIGTPESYAGAQWFFGTGLPE